MSAAPRFTVERRELVTHDQGMYVSFCGSNKNLASCLLEGKSGFISGIIETKILKRIYSWEDISDEITMTSIKKMLNGKSGKTIFKKDYGRISFGQYGEDMILVFLFTGRRDRQVCWFLRGFGGTSSFFALQYGTSQYVELERRQCWCLFGIDTTVS